MSVVLDDDFYEHAEDLPADRPPEVPVAPDVPRPRDAADAPVPDRAPSGG